jgi:hypothetical protein
MLPEYALRAAVIIQLRRIASVDLKTLSPDDREFWRRYLIDGVRARGLKECATASARLQLDYHRNSGERLDDLKDNLAEPLGANRGAIVGRAPHTGPIEVPASP